MLKVYPSVHRPDVFGTSMGPLVCFSWSVDISCFLFCFLVYVCVFPLLLVLVVLPKSENSFALLNMSAKFTSIFRNVKNSCLVSLWSSTCYFICYICVWGGGGGETACVHRE